MGSAYHIYNYQVLFRTVCHVHQNTYLWDLKNSFIIDVRSEQLKSFCSGLSIRISFGGRLIGKTWKAKEMSFINSNQNTYWVVTATMSTTAMSTTTISTTLNSIYNCFQPFFNIVIHIKYQKRWILQSSGQILKWFLPRVLKIKTLFFRIKYFNVRQNNGAGSGVNFTNPLA